MNFGNVFKEERKKKNFTQEQVSQDLKVSCQAVSKWETNSSFPDISLLPIIADYFGVTIDYLLGHDTDYNSKEKILNEYLELSTEYAQKGEVLKELALWREAVQKFPGDYRCLMQLASSLLGTVYIDVPFSEKEANAKECIAICERILNECTENDYRDSVIQTLTFLYSYKHFSFANEETAVKYAMMAGMLPTCREFLLEAAYFTEESKGTKQSLIQNNILHLMDYLTMDLYNGDYDTNEDEIKAAQASLKLWEILFYDGNYQFYHARIEYIYKKLATLYARAKNKQETIEALKKTLYHAEKFDNFPNEKQGYTSIFLNKAKYGDYTKNYTDTDKELILEYMKSDVFDFVRNDEGFKNLELEQ